MTGDFESSDDHCSKTSPERTDVDMELESRVPIVASSNNSKQLPRKTFAAPPPPQQDLTVSISSKSSELLKELTIDKHNSPLRGHNISPGKEAIEILDDLCKVALKSDVCILNIFCRSWTTTRHPAHPLHLRVATKIKLQNLHPTLKSTTKHLVIELKICPMCTLLSQMV